MLSLRTRPTTDLTIPVEDKLGNRYILEFGLFPYDQLGIETAVVDITLISTHLHVKPNFYCLCQLCNKVLSYMDIHDAIFYFYYDNKDDFNRRDRGISPQLHRSRLFNNLINRFCTESYIIKNIEIEDTEVNNHYITLISTEDRQNDMNQIHAEILKLSKTQF